MTKKKTFSASSQGSVDLSDDRISALIQQHIADYRHTELREKERRLVAKLAGVREQLGETGAPEEKEKFKMKGGLRRRQIHSSLTSLHRHTVDFSGHLTPSGRKDNFYSLPRSASQSLADVMKSSMSQSSLLSVPGPDAVSLHRSTSSMSLCSETSFEHTHCDPSSLLQLDLEDLNEQEATMHERNIIGNNGFISSHPIIPKSLY